ncbi:uncharacterized protein N7479_008903 [Penicillium vulpinum]|uniref:uncharacterized protein n=1 Tax=Penicillium vulpinum TaxID=29845 RepID=UPI002546AA8C|nr:uncharacterized protein N7479_008903 [Penicillium vulpinum]KAJ5950490.1 hypothetical protein N7479_008903 [Penicillium vulpinum]
MGNAGMIRIENVESHSSLMRPTGPFETHSVMSHYIYRSPEYLSIMLRYSGLFGLVCNSPVQGQFVTQRPA